MMWKVDMYRHPENNDAQPNLFLSAFVLLRSLETVNSVQLPTSSGLFVKKENC